MGPSLGVAKPISARPNILFILADDLGYADVSCYGRPDYQTPNVDRIASQGMRFMQAYANSAVCSATRTALITGRYQDRLDVGLDEPNGVRDVGLPPDHPTLPSLLKKVGYSTALIGKWHLGSLPKFGPLQSGYDHFVGIRSGGQDYFKYDSDYWIDDTLAHETGYLTDRLGDHAVSMIETLAAQPNPFFISLHFTSPHWPWEGPNDQAESDRLAKNPSGLFVFDGGTQETYAQMVMALDTQIGRALDALERAGLASNTIVIFTSDNGGERFSDTWPFNGKKGELLEGGIRVPTIVYWPGRVAPNTVSNQVIMSMDWLPTLLAAAGTRPDRHYPSDGMNFIKTLEGKTTPKPRKLFWRYNALHQEAVRDGDLKYLKILDNTFLFNVVDDPLERANLKDRLPDVFNRLATDWQAWNKTMLPYTDKNYSWTGSGKELADHFGSPGGVDPRPTDTK
ncbi:MAG: sulfatase-like hydrolase/transferase [Alphaproteobacteria bacterium]